MKLLRKIIRSTFLATFIMDVWIKLYSQSIPFLLGALLMTFYPKGRKVWLVLAITMLLMNTYAMSIADIVVWLLALLLYH